MQAADGHSGCPKLRRCSFANEQAALAPWRDGSASPTDSTALLPPHLESFSRDLDRFSRHGDFRLVTCEHLEA